jgi:hypothetical protein
LEYFIDLETTQFFCVGIVSPNACVLTFFTLRERERERGETLHEWNNSLAEYFGCSIHHLIIVVPFASSALIKLFLKM